MKKPNFGGEKNQAQKFSLAIPCKGQKSNETRTITPFNNATTAIVIILAYNNKGHYICHLLSAYTCIPLLNLHNIAESYY